MKIKNTSGLTFEFLENGAVKSIEAGPIRINLKPSTIFSKPGTNFYLRKRGNPIQFKALTGPGSESHYSLTENTFIAAGTWSGIDYTCVLQLSEKSAGWQWSAEIINRTGQAVELDLVYLQDVGLKPVNAGLLNEYYVSQYLERLVLQDERFGSVAVCRQNMKEPTGNPWLMLACKNGALSASTDGMQFYGKSYRETGIPEGLLVYTLSGEYAGESSVFALQEKPFIIASGKSHLSSFIGIYLPDHPRATSKADLKFIPGVFSEMESRSSKGTPSQNLFTSSSFLPVDDLSMEVLNELFGEEQHHPETENNQLLSFFSRESHHVVLRAKELLADRPHAHIMQTKTGFVPDENIMATTAFAFGVFNSHISQGNTNFNVLLSVCTSQFNQSPESGQRIFVEIDGMNYLLGVPSAFEMGLNHCRWIYRYGSYCFQVRSWTSKTATQVNLDFKVLSGKPVKLIITHDFDLLNGWRVMPGKSAREFVTKPEAGSMIVGKFPGAQYRIVVQGNTGFRSGSDELLYSNYKSHGSPLFVIETGNTSGFCMSFTGEVCQPSETIYFADADDQWMKDFTDARTDWQKLSLNLDLKSENSDILAIREILPWYGMNALTHFLTPYGLEQFSGAAWGTRDVAQGPVDLLLNLGKYNEARKVLLTLFSNQNPDGGWPQWWMFDSYADIRSDSSHDDIYYWCLIALASYIKTTGDMKILKELLPYYHEKGPDHAEKTTLDEHTGRLIKMITGSFIPGTALVPFGGGDWNDSLQPVSRKLAGRMISSWTVEMNYQAFADYRDVFVMTGETDKADKLQKICGNIKSDFNKHLVKDGVVAGYGLVEKDGTISVMLHPSDNRTGVHYSILPMDRGILSGIFTKEQALIHQEIIEQHLKGPDGARLMDRPLKYKGGIQEIFQRAESSTFFGREIGLMYVHEHIRYAESLARMGKADAFVKALRQAIPVGYRDVVPCGDIRQANCYYSSSDVHFKSRYEADERYDEIKSGNITLRGGWRVYSSGPGIYIGLVISRLLGLRIESGNVIIDPVLAFSMDGLSVSMDFLGKKTTFNYSVKEANISPKAIFINGKEISFIYEDNKYRKGGAVVPSSFFLDHLSVKENFIKISL